MTVLNKLFKSDPNGFYIVHPLYDAPEEKRDPERLGTMRMTRSVTWSLFALRAYLVLMLALTAYRLAEQSGLLGHLVH